MNRQVPLYSFGPFHLDTEQELLLRDVQPVRLEPKVLEVLAVLVQNHGRVVRKDELMKQVWPNSFVEEGNLASSICKIRRALGETGNGHTFVETVPKRGYRFVPSVTEVVDDGHRAPSSGSAGDDGGLKKDTIAVLPFKPIGASIDELGLAMADSLITRICSLGRFAVCSTRTVSKYVGALDPVAAGRELCVEWVLDGSIQKSGQQARVSVQLLNVREATLMWARRFDGQVTNVFGIEDLISEDVAIALSRFTDLLTRR